MDIVVHAELLPEEYSPSEHHIDVQGNGGGKELPFTLLPFTYGEMWRARGLLYGLGHSFIEGEIVCTCHEGLFKATGEVTIYGEESLKAFNIVMHLLEMSLRAIAGSFIGERHIITAKYSFEWVDEMGQDRLTDC